MNRPLRHSAKRAPRATMDPGDLERALFHWPNVIASTDPGTWSGQFARSVASRSNRRGWRPSVKEWPIMHRMVRDLFTADDDSDVELIEREG